MADERLKYYIEAIWKGKNATAEARRDIESVGDAGMKGKQGADAFSQSSLNMGSVLKSVAAAGALGVIANQALEFGKASINAASDAEESYGKFSVVFGQFADATEAELDKLADATGRSKYELIDYASTIQDTFVPLGFAREEAAKMSTSITELAIDLASFNNLETADVIRDLQSALVGNTETLRKYGVVAQETQIKQEAMNLGLWDGKGAIDAQVKAQAILSLTYKGTTDAQGDAIRTADSYANKQRELEGAITDLQVVIGQGLTPAMEYLTQKAIDGANNLELFFSVMQRGGDVVDEIIAKNVKQAESVDDLVEQYKRIREQQNKWLGLAPALTGTTDDLARAEKEVRDAIALNVETSDEYIEVLRELLLVNSDHSEAAARRYYDELRAADATATVARETSTADSVMLGYAGTVDIATGATNEMSPALERLRQEYIRAAAGTDEFKEKTGQSADELARAAGVASAFNSSFVAALDDTESAYGRWVTTSTAVGGRTDEQEKNFQDLQSEAERLRNNINSLQGGTAALGLTQDEVNDKLATQYERLALVESAMAPLADITTEYTNTQSKWVVDSEALNSSLFSQIAGMSDNAIVTATATIALGEYDEAQIEAALNAAIIQEQIKALAERFVEAEGEGVNLRQEMENIVAGSPYTTEIEALVDEAIGNIEKVKSKLDSIERNIDVKINISERTTGSAGDSGGAGGGRVPEFAGGGMVPGPIGSPQLILAHGGEQVLTPGQQQGASMINNITINMPNALEPTQVATAVVDSLGRLT